MAHSVDRVLGFFTCRPNRDPPPSPAGEVCPPLWAGGGNTRLRERGVPIWTRGPTLWHFRYMCTYFVVCPFIVCFWQAITAWLVGTDVQPDLGAGHLIISALQLRCPTLHSLSSYKILTINVPVPVNYMPWEKWFWCGQHPFRGPLEGVGPESRDFFGPWNVNLRTKKGQSCGPMPFWPPDPGWVKVRIRILDEQPGSLSTVRSGSYMEIFVAIAKFC